MMWRFIRYPVLGLIIVLVLVANAPAILWALLWAAGAVFYVMGSAVLHESGGILKGFALLALDSLIGAARLVNWLIGLKPKGPRKRRKP